MKEKFGLDLHVDDVAGAILSKEDHDLLEQGLKAVIPHKIPNDPLLTPAKLLDDLTRFYATHDDPNVKKLAKVVIGFRDKLNLL